MILGEELVPLSKLSAAFLSPKDLQHLDFAYYEASLAVEFLVGRFGQEALRKVLGALGQGLPVDQAMEKHVRPLPQLEKDFAAYACELAKKMGPGLDWEKPPAKLYADAAAESLEDWGQKHPNNFWALTEQAKKLLAAKQYAAAQAPLKRLVEAYPDNTGADNALLLLAEVHRALKAPDQERKSLAQLASLDADALDVFLRLMELSAQAQDWPAVRENAERYLAVNPLVAPPYRFLAQASEGLDQTGPAIQSYRMLLLMEPPDPGDLHYRLARRLWKTGDPSAKRQVLQALEEAPRFRDAHRLLLEINRDVKLTAPGGQP
jgi:tetratricopeptide (TPR) repeat protein